MVDGEQNKKSGSRDRDLPSVHRARNRTVVLTPDITGQVRAKLASEAAQSSEEDGSGYIRPKKGQSSSNKISRPEEPPKEVVEDKAVSKEKGKEASKPGNDSSSSYVNEVGLRRKPKPSRSEATAQPSSEEAASYSPVSQPNRVEVPPLPIDTSALEEIPAVSSVLVGFLVSFDRIEFGEAYELREGRSIVSSDVPSGGGRVILLKDESISSMHAIIKADDDGSVMVLDQLSDRGTFLTKSGGQETIQLEGERALLNHGDELKFGERTFKVCLISKG